MLLEVDAIVKVPRLEKHMHAVTLTSKTPRKVTMFFMEYQHLLTKVNVFHLPDNAAPASQTQPAASQPAQWCPH